MQCLCNVYAIVHIYGKLLEDIYIYIYDTVWYDMFIQMLYATNDAMWKKTHAPSQLSKYLEKSGIVPAIRDFCPMATWKV